MGAGSGVKPYNLQVYRIVGILNDGRQFEVQVRAISLTEAVEQAESQFPELKITDIERVVQPVVQPDILERLESPEVVVPITSVAPAKKRKDDIQVLRVGGNRLFGTSTPHVYRIVSKLKDGRRFETRVNALSQKEAVSTFNTKFPLAVVMKVNRADKIRSAKKFLEGLESYLER
jgi:hypothetical protein